MVINGAIVSDLDMMYLESVLQEEQALCMMMRWVLKQSRKQSMELCMRMVPNGCTRIDRSTGSNWMVYGGQPMGRRWGANKQRNVNTKSSFGLFVILIVFVEFVLHILLSSTTKEFGIFSRLNGEDSWSTVFTSYLNIAGQNGPVIHTYIMYLWLRINHRGSPFQFSRLR